MGMVLVLQGLLKCQSVSSFCSGCATVYKRLSPWRRVLPAAIPHFGQLAPVCSLLFHAAACQLEEVQKQLDSQSTQLQEAEADLTKATSSVEDLQRLATELEARTEDLQ